MPPPPPPRKKPFRPGTLVGSGRYRLVRKLGSGGNGLVWLAEHVNMGSEVVIKMPRVWHAKNTEGETQLRDEATCLAELSNKHPHIVNVLDVVRDANSIYLVLQYMRNGSLLDYCKKPDGDGRRILTSSLAWLQQISGALDYLHANRFVHRDVKPHNILLDDSHSAYLADFGIAGLSKRMAPPKDNLVTGSLPYMAPEILSGAPPSPGADQYSLAVTLLEFCLCVAPFQGRSAAEMLTSQTDLASAWSKASRVPGLSASLSAALIPALSPAPGSRYPSCQAFAHAVSIAWPSASEKAPPRRPPSSETAADRRSSETATQASETTRQRPPLPQLKQRDARLRLKLDRLLGDGRSSGVERDPPPPGDSKDPP